jgi:hypothetical protein
VVDASFTLQAYLVPLCSTAGDHNKTDQRCDRTNEKNGSSS